MRRIWIDDRTTERRTHRNRKNAKSVDHADCTIQRRNHATNWMTQRIRNSNESSAALYSRSGLKSSQIELFKVDHAAQFWICRQQNCESTIDSATIDHSRSDSTTKTIRCFEQCPVETSSLTVNCRTETSDSSANDDNVVECHRTILFGDSNKFCCALWAIPNFSRSGCALQIVTARNAIRPLFREMSTIWRGHKTKNQGNPRDGKCVRAQISHLSREPLIFSQPQSDLHKEQDAQNSNCSEQSENKSALKGGRHGASSHLRKRNPLRMAPLFTTVHARSCESFTLVCNMFPAEKT